MNSSAPHSMLPEPTPEESAHAQATTSFLLQRLSERGGWMPFDEFMDLALYAPGLGYYSAGTVKLGAAGDFVTAPEISDLFSRCVARQCADLLAETGGSILELGAGTGRMACAILAELAVLGVLPERYAILEVSADLADRQRARVHALPPELRDRVVWLDSLPTAPLRGVILANEVLDALPCQRFVVRDAKALELGVTGTTHSKRTAWDGDESAFAWALAPAGDDNSADAINQQLPSEPVTASTARPSNPVSASGAIDSMLGQLPAPLPDGYVSEICPRVDAWINSIAGCLESGARRLFDYGLPRSHYYHPQRGDGTLRCYFRQRAHDDPFINVGIQDITAWVDFTRVAEAALGAHLEVAGFVTQAAFLLGCGIEGLLAGANSDLERARLAGEARRLLMPGEMGESFKAMALCRNLQQPLRGFAYQDLRGSL